MWHLVRGGSARTGDAGFVGGGIGGGPGGNTGGTATPGDDTFVSAAGWNDGRLGARALLRSGRTPGAVSESVTKDSCTGQREHGVQSAAFQAGGRHHCRPPPRTGTSRVMMYQIRQRRTAEIRRKNGGGGNRHQEPRQGRQVILRLRTPLPPPSPHPHRHYRRGRPIRVRPGIRRRGACEGRDAGGLPADMPQYPRSNPRPACLVLQPASRPAMAGQGAYCERAHIRL